MDPKQLAELARLLGEQGNMGSSTNQDNMLARAAGEQGNLSEKEQPFDLENALQKYRDSLEPEFEQRLHEDAAPRTNVPWYPARSQSAEEFNTDLDRGGAYYGGESLSEAKLPPQHKNRRRLDQLMKLLGK